MSDNSSNGRYGSRVSRDADDIAGFFSTRTGTIVAFVILGVVAIGMLFGIVSGLFA